jgi:hypothetical protein
MLTSISKNFWATSSLILRVSRISSRFLMPRLQRRRPYGDLVTTPRSRQERSRSD